MSEIVPHASVCGYRFFVEVHYYHLSLNLKFHKDLSFRDGDICKTTDFLKSSISKVFCLFPQFAPPKSSSVRITQEYLNFL